MKAFVAGFLFVTLAGTTLADVNYSLATGQAKRDANQNNAQQGVKPSQPQTPSAPQPPPVNPALAATLQNIADLRADLDALSQAADAPSGDDQRASLMTHLSAAAQDKMASVTSVEKLAAQLVAAASGRKNLSAQDAVLARNIHALFNSSHLSATQRQTLLDAVKKILTDAGLPGDEADSVVNDLKQVAAEVQ